MTKYELDLQKKQEKAEKRQLRKEKRRAKRIERKTKRKARRAKRRFQRQSNAKYRWYHRWLVKLLRIGGPIGAFIYIGFKIFDLFGDIRTDNTIGTLDLDMAVILLFFSSIVFMAAVWYGLKWMKKATEANAVARNQGQPSLYYSPVVVTTMRFLLGLWLFGIMYLFNYIGLHYGEAMHNGFEYMFYAYGGGFLSLFIGDLIEQGILKNVRNLKHRAEHESREDIKDLRTQIQALKKEE